jgi:hypothetical protein
MIAKRPDNPASTTSWTVCAWVTLRQPSGRSRVAVNDAAVEECGNLTPVLEKSSEQVRRLRVSDPAIHLRGVVAGRLVEEADAMLDGARLFVGGAKIKPGNPREGDRAGAHRAGFEGNVEMATDQTFALKLCGCGAENEDFGMSGGIAALDGAIAVLGQDRAVRADNDCPHWHFTS